MQEGRLQAEVAKKHQPQQVLAAVAVAKQGLISAEEAEVVAVGLVRVVSSRVNHLVYQVKKGNSLLVDELEC